MHPSARARIALSALATLSLLLAAGCRKHQATDAPPPKPAPPPQVGEVDLKTYRPDETGAVMVLMFHQFRPDLKESDMNRTPEHFRKDLQALWDGGYRPVNLSDFVQNKMDVPAGKTPIVLTFDDAWPSQFKVISGTDGRPHIDPDCVIGILEKFSKAHADPRDPWRMRGTFFVLPHEGRNGDPFGQPDMVGEKLAYLTKNGYEIGNHTSTHSSLRGMPVQRVRWEIATAVRDIKQIDPQAQMQLLALPYGNLPHPDAMKALLNGEDGGTRYHNIGVVLAAWRPMLAPTTKKTHRYAEGGSLSWFDPYRIERIKADPSQATKPGTLEYWLKYFKDNPAQRYVSGGNPRVAVMPASRKSMVDESRIRALGKVVQYYSTGGSIATQGGGSGGSGLSVD